MAFDMPAIGTWEQRGGWVMRALAGEFGLTLDQAAGIVGNLGFESAGFEQLQEIGVKPPFGGWGWAQWTASRRRGFEAWAESEDLAPTSDAANYGFLCYELRGSHKQTIAALRQCNTIDAAVWSVGQTYERPGGTTATHLPGYGGRCDYARRAYAGALAAAEPPQDNPLSRAIAEALDALTRLQAVPAATITEEIEMTIGTLLQNLIDAISAHFAAKQTPVDSDALLDELAAAHPDLNVRTSIVDLMLALGFTMPTLAERRELASELGIEGDVGSAETNATMHRALLQSVAKNGGKVPDELL